MSATCDSCLKALPPSRNAAPCGLCGRSLCKACAQIVDEDAFSFLKNVPEDLTRGVYCGPCYDAKVAPALESYDLLMERAREIGVFYKNERNLPAHRALNKKVQVADCPDRKEALLRLAFLAAEQSCNALVNVELVSKKINTAGYQKTHWSGAGFPARVFTSR